MPTSPGARRLSDTILNDKTLKDKASPDDLAAHVPPHLLKQIIIRLRSENDSARKKLEYSEKLLSRIPPADLRALEVDVFGTKPNDQPDFIKNGQGAQSALRESCKDENAITRKWQSVRYPEGDEYPCQELEDDECPGDHEVPVSQNGECKTFSEWNLTVEDGRFVFVDDCSADYDFDSAMERKCLDKIISAAMLFHRVTWLDFDIMEERPREIRMVHQDKSVLALTYYNWNGIKLRFTPRTEEAKTDLLEFLGFVCGPSGLQVQAQIKGCLSYFGNNWEDD